MSDDFTEILSEVSRKLDRITYYGDRPTLPEWKEWISELKTDLTDFEMGLEHDDENCPYRDEVDNLEHDLDDLNDELEEVKSELSDAELTIEKLENTQPEPEPDLSDQYYRVRFIRNTEIVFQSEPRFEYWTDAEKYLNDLAFKWSDERKTWVKTTRPISAEIVSGNGIPF